MVTNGSRSRDSSQTPWSKMPRSNPKVPNLAWVRQVNQTKVAMNTASIAASPRTGPSRAAVVAQRRPATPGAGGPAGSSVA
jgi:hypothetical protein